MEKQVGKIIDNVDYVYTSTMLHVYTQQAENGE